MEMTFAIASSQLWGGDGWQVAGVHIVREILVRVSGRERDDGIGVRLLARGAVHRYSPLQGYLAQKKTPTLL